MMLTEAEQILDRFTALQGWTAGQEARLLLEFIDAEGLTARFEQFLTERAAAEGPGVVNELVELAGHLGIAPAAVAEICEIDAPDADLAELFQIALTQAGCVAASLIRELVLWTGHPGHRFPTTPGTFFRWREGDTYRVTFMDDEAEKSTQGVRFETAAAARAAYPHLAGHWMEPDQDDPPDMEALAHWDDACALWPELAEEESA